MGVSSALKHVHEQPDASTEWTVVHNLNTLAPIVDVMVDVAGGLQKMLPLDITVIDSKSIKILFSVERTGKVSVV